MLLQVLLSTPVADIANQLLLSGNSETTLTIIFHTALQGSQPADWRCQLLWNLFAILQVGNIEPSKSIKDGIDTYSGILWRTPRKAYGLQLLL